MCYSPENYTLTERKGVGSVTMCTCGTMHLSVGGITLRLAPEVFGELLRMCQEAAERLMLKAELTPSASTLAH